MTTVTSGPELWQPRLQGPLLQLRPLEETDFEPLFLAASDPLIWEQHPDRLRYTRNRFAIYFRNGMESRGALAILDRATGELIGSSRFTGHRPELGLIEIGYTFLIRNRWGGKSNGELKTLMLDHAFQQVETVCFVVGRENLRSRKALEKLGATLDPDDGSPSVSYRIRRENWINSQNRA